MHRPVPPIAQSRQRISPMASSPIVSPMSMMGQQAPPPPQQTVEDAIAEDIQDLAMEIYSRLAIDHIRSQSPDSQALQALAQSAQLAARAYFESLGVHLG